jgi:hypothetical protein
MFLTLGDGSGNDPSVLKLTDEQRGRLLGLRRGPGFDDLVDLLARLCEESERNLFRLDQANGAKPEQICAAQNQCRAQRLYMESALGEIELQVNALVEGQAAKGAPPVAVQTPGAMEPVLDLQDAADVLGLMPGS